jgi:hypothetical protein
MMRYASLLVLWLVSTATSSPLITAENWTAGLDTTKTGWFMQHPLWLDMKAKFQHKCDSIEAVLSKQIPAKQDSIWLTDTAWTVVDGRKGKWRTKDVVADREQDPHVLLMYPTVVRGQPRDSSPGIRVLPAGSGPWKISKMFSNGKCIYCSHFLESPPEVGVSNEPVSRFLPSPKWNGMLTNYVLLVDTTGRPVGWAPGDSVVYFKSFNKAQGALPFYRDGFAEFLDGTWKDRYQRDKTDERRVFENLPASKNNPVATYWVNWDVTKVDMRRREFRILSDLSEGFHDTKELNERISEKTNHLPTRVYDAYVSVAYHPKTKDPYLYFDPRKTDTSSIVPIPWYSGLTLASIQPFSLESGPGQVRLSKEFSSQLQKPALTLHFNTNEDPNSRPTDIQLVFRFPVRSLSEGKLDGLNYYLAEKRQLEFIQ